MPFDNEITIVELTGEKMNELINYIIDRKKPIHLTECKLF
ncbi:hypothetical protein JCM19296_1367 [Nonlabens ulvanivorans]|uniref:Uncharacterized protein n=1 Tax=Nonlabens ulvanivorans TaxID=906888 RepID=A0A081DA29_NONUL|nr:hypothetical protein JCM19296_1367 [Nonlabens ulvanivorans]